MTGVQTCALPIYALVVLGNSAQPANPRVVTVLADYRSHADPILREHAEWATERLGLETR